MSDAACDSDTVPYWVRRSAPGGVYDQMLQWGLGTGTDSLGGLEPGVSIVLGNHFGGHQKYVRPDQSPIYVHLIGEFAAGTKVHPTGNHSFPTGNFEPIRDNNRVKLNWTIKCLEGAPERIRDVFYNQVTTLNNATVSEEANMRRTAQAKPSSPDKRMQKRPLNSPASPGSDDSSSTLSSCDQEELLAKKVGDAYPASAMPGYGGNWFQTSSACRVVQLDITDPSSTLLPPWEWYKWIVEGTLVYLTAEMYIYEYDGRKYHSLSMKSMQVLDKGDLLPVKPVPRVMESASTSRARLNEQANVAVPAVSPGRIKFSAGYVPKGKQRADAATADADGSSKTAKRRLSPEVQELEVSRTKRNRSSK
ncbi:hypothetical protein K435DRAFT_803117 [Dendrothele bispora CBS 962.96]|uniref:Uncharacterized protein n=1 Tax=Dendrothele bispora (strain CBS 962.96) TaxID=1314807 RepID=A0A4S8LIS8_DENBC|nr:hypothetical protein K435DRAFT_803117 [Dendrothele bispora CBS 962.96]